MKSAGFRSRSRGNNRKRHHNYMCKYQHKNRTHRRLEFKKRSESTQFTEKRRHRSRKQMSHHKEEHRRQQSKKEKEKDRSKDAGHYKYEVGERIEHYQIERHISDGTFGRCFRVKNINNQQIYVMKVVRAVKRYIETAKMEVQILEFINRKEYGSVRYYESFKY